MNRCLILIDFDGSATTFKDFIKPGTLPPFVEYAVNIGKRTLKSEEVKRASFTDNENIAKARYALLYRTFDKVFYGRFE